MPDRDLKNATFKYTVPISKAEADEDGLYITGEATGPEVDLHEERIAPEAIKAFANQIKDRYANGDPIPYLDEHDKSTSGRGVLRHLGDLVDGEITENNHLWVKVRLNDDNPAATFLYRQIQAGKKFGMSINGDVLSYADELVKSLGRKIRTFKSVVLTHVANTTRPVWTPSLGTVLNRAVEKALADEGDGEEMAEEIVAESTETKETPAVETTPETPAKTDTKSEAVATETPETESTLSKKIDALVEGVSAMLELLKTKEPVLATVEHSEKETPEPEISKSEPSEEDKRFAKLEAELAEIKEQSSTQRPPVITKSQRDEFEGLLKDLSPSERLRVALSAIHGEDL
jgi:phage head maturation protease